MQVKRWMLGAGVAIALVSIAQAQIAPSSKTMTGGMVSPEVVALRNEVAKLRSDLSKAQSDIASIKVALKEKSAIGHIHAVNGGLTNKGFCGAPPAGIVPC